LLVRVHETTNGRNLVERERLFSGSIHFPWVRDRAEISSRLVNYSTKRS